MVAKDVTAAVAALTAQLDEQLAAVAPSPPGLAAGATAYPETARRGEPVPSEPAAAIVGREAGSFDLTLTAQGSVVTADPTPLEAIGAARIAAAVPQGMQAREGSVGVEVGPGVVEGETVRYAVEARAEAVRDITRRRGPGARPREGAGRGPCHPRRLRNRGDRHLAGLGIDDHLVGRPARDRRRGRAAGGADARALADAWSLRGTSTGVGHGASRPERAADGVPAP